VSVDLGRRKLILACLALLAVAAGGSAVTYAAFTATTTNSGSSFSAASSFPATLRVASGSYTGNASDNRAITDPGFQPDLVIVKADNNQIGVARTSTMTGDASKPLDGTTALSTQRIKSLTATGFTLGTNGQVNSNGVIYRWTAFKANNGALTIGSYTGNGAATRAITGVGFSPEYVSLLGAGAQAPVQRVSGMTTSFRFGSGTSVANAVNIFDSDGFTVGNGAEANTNGTVYHYVAFNEVAGTIQRASYTGNNTDNRAITGVGFQPDYMMIRANDTATARVGRHRPAALTGTSSQFFSAAANDAAGIKALQSDGFQVGTNANVNANGVTYHYIAFQNTAGGCSLPGPQTLSASADSWVDENSPTTNNGTASTFRVTSRNAARNTRALVQYALPTVPSGCNLTDAKLRLNNRTPASGRTLEVLRNSASWTETGVNWNNQPATTGTAATATTPSSPSFMEWDVTSQVQSMYAGTNDGFLVRDQTENGANLAQVFDSREASSNRPELVLTLSD